ncbi:hypothetical protein Pcinc_010948 [Petrolisthes cinctipes]|uniref:Uncharacterized protein n=1 Tax=Petrolisthes cinctipes TaxID=88211 RepID=A0AAE1G3R9_PETCI|nr:hypothetical protein Pcinc_010948 [Petrolisthes cinctipes]
MYPVSNPNPIQPNLTPSQPLTPMHPQRTSLLHPHPIHLSPPLSPNPIPPLSSSPIPPPTHLSPPHLPSLLTTIPLLSLISLLLQSFPLHHSTSLLPPTHFPSHSSTSTTPLPPPVSPPQPTYQPRPEPSCNKCRIPSSQLGGRNDNT